MADAILNPANVNWVKGYLFGTISGAAADSTPFAELQDIKVSWSQTFEKLKGPGSLSAIGVGISERALTFTARYAKIRGQQLAAALGMTNAYSSPKTTGSMGVNAEPALFNLHLISNGSSAISAATDKFLEINLFSCIINTMDIDFTLNTFAMANFSGEVLGNGTNLFQIILPGDQTTS